MSTVPLALSTEHEVRCEIGHGTPVFNERRNDMSKIEILVYSPKNMDKFKEFCVKGKRNSSGDFETDDQNRDIRGVFDWLHGREVPKARFFHTPADHPFQFFIALVQKNEKE